MDEKLVKGKIVQCEGRSLARGPFYAGAVGALIQGQILRDYAPTLPLPGSYLDLLDGASVYDYINSTRYLSTKYSIYINQRR